MAQSKLNTTLAHNQSCTLHDLQLIVTVHLIIQQLVYHANQRFFFSSKSLTDKIIIVQRYIRFGFFAAISGLSGFMPKSWPPCYVWLIFKLRIASLFYCRSWLKKLTIRCWQPCFAKHKQNCDFIQLCTFIGYGIILLLRYNFKWFWIGLVRPSLSHYYSKINAEGTCLDAV